MPDSNIKISRNLSLSHIAKKDVCSTETPSRLSVASGKTSLSRKSSAVSANDAKTSTPTKMSESKKLTYLDKDLPKSTACVSSLLCETKSVGASSRRRRLSLKSLSFGIIGFLKLKKSVASIPKQSKLMYENTYKMGPDSGRQFPISKVQQIAADILKAQICNSLYSSDRGRYLARTVSEEIKAKVKELGLARYKIVCQLIITEVNDQGIQTASRCLWEPTMDNFTTATYKSQTICATAMIFGVYLD